jgi:hypothetical protein
MDKGRPLGPLAATAFRAVMVFLSLLITAAASLILVRRLDPIAYAAFQTLTRRIVVIARFPLGVLGFWIYRYVAQGVKGSMGAGVIVSIATGAFSAMIGFLAAWWLRLKTETAMLASAALGVFLAYQGLLNIVNAARPLRHPLVVFTYRLLYSLGAVILVYFLHNGLEGALASLAVAAMAAALLSAAWLRAKTYTQPLPLREYLALIAEWIRGSSASIALTLGMLIASLDAIVAYVLSNESVVAAYFVARIPFSLVIDAFSIASMYLAGFLLSGGDVRDAALSTRLTLLMVAFVSGYLAANPASMIYLLNPSYHWASNAIAVMAIAAYLDVLSRGLLNTLTGTIKGRVAESVGQLRVIGLKLTLANVLYLLLEVVVLRYSESPISKVTLWIASYAATTVLLIVSLMGSAPQNLRRAINENAPAIALYPFIAFATSLPFRVSAYHTRFWDQVQAMLPSVAASLALYIVALLVLDPFFRRVSRRGLHLVKDFFGKLP